MLGIPRRFSHFVFGCHSVRPDLRDRGGDRELPIPGRRDVRRALAAIMVCRLDHDVAGCGIRCTRYSGPDALPDTGRLTARSNRVAIWIPRRSCQPNRLPAAPFVNCLQRSIIVIDGPSWGRSLSACSKQSRARFKLPAAVSRQATLVGPYPVRRILVHADGAKEFVNSEDRPLRP